MRPLGALAALVLAALAPAAAAEAAPVRIIPAGSPAMTARRG